MPILFSRPKFVFGKVGIEFKATCSAYHVEQAEDLQVVMRYKLVLFLSLFMFNSTAWSDTDHYGLQVDVKREGRVYAYSASFKTPLTKCIAYQYLIDYKSKKELPGVVDLLFFRQSANKVNVELTADEPVLIFNVRIHSVIEYTETPFESLTFRQLTGNSKLFQGNWTIEPNSKGSTLFFKGLWEPDTIVPLIIIDQFANQTVTNKFNAIAELAEKYKSIKPTTCVD